jgi:hypothetical protein
MAWGLPSPSAIASTAIASWIDVRSTSSPPISHPATHPLPLRV